MIALIKGISYRMSNNKSFLIMPFVITPIIIFVAIYFSISFIARPTIGVVGANKIQFENDNVNIIKLEKKATISDLVKDKYDAVISFEGDKVQIDTIKNSEYKNKVKKIIEGKSVNFNDGEKRGVAANIIGFITMFVLLSGVMLYKFFFDDKKCIANRILSANISYKQYILSHFISVFIMIFIPIVTITILAKNLFQLNTNITALEIIFIILILSFLSSAFGLLISSIVKELESASLLGFMISLLTTLLSGSFFTVSNNDLINKLGSILPQKHILDFTIALENGHGANCIHLLNVILISFIMIICSLLINKHKMRRYNCM